MGSIKKLLCIATALVLIGGLAFARPQSKYIDVTLDESGETGETNTAYGVVGYIEEIVVTCSDMTSTGIVAVTYTPQDYTNTAINLATGTATAEKVWRPRVDSTTVAGADNTGDTPVRFMIVKGELITVAITSSESTNCTWRCRIKYDDGR